MFARLVIPAIVAASMLMPSMLMAVPPVPPRAVGTISSSAPITINGSEMSPTLAPFWPLAAKDEIATSASALLQTAGRNLLTLDANSKARIDAAGNGLEYIYIRQGGLHFDARTGPIYVCIGDHLYVPAKSARGTLRFNASGAVDSSLELGVLLEQGTRVCGQDASVDFLSGLPKAAGGTIGAAPGGLSTRTRTAITVGAALAALLPAFFSSTPCGLSSGCNFNPPAISPSQP
jgi:hypothetical protein